jgi:hypothetical protein
MDAIYRAGINTGGILYADAGFSNDIGIGYLPTSRPTLILGQRRFKREHGKLSVYGAKN